MCADLKIWPLPTDTREARGVCLKKLAVAFVLLFCLFSVDSFAGIKHADIPATCETYEECSMDPNYQGSLWDDFFGWLFGDPKEDCATTHSNLSECTSKCECEFRNAMRDCDGGLLCEQVQDSERRVCTTQCGIDYNG